MDPADQAAGPADPEDQPEAPGREAASDAGSGRPGKAPRDKALDDLVAELFFELDRAESDEPRSWLQLERRRAKRSG